MLHLLTNHLRQQWRDAPTAGDRFRHLRDAVILNLSFFGLLRKSDAAALSWKDVQTDRFHHYVLITIPRSKTDQAGEGVTIPVLLTAPAAHHDWTDLWWAYVNLFTDRPGAAFLPSTSCPSHGRRCVLWEKPLHHQALGQILPRRLEDLRKHHLLPDLHGSFASHSLRRGGSTWMGSRGAPEQLQRLLGRWSTAIWRRYCDTPWPTMLGELANVA